MERIKTDDLYQYHFLSEVHASPKGGRVAFVERTAQRDRNGYRAKIWVLDTATGQSRSVTGNGDESSFRWLDEDHLLFPSARSGDQPGSTAFYRLSLCGGEAERLFTVPLAVKRFYPLPDGRLLVLSRVPMEKCPETRPDHAEVGRELAVFDELPLWADGIGFISGTRMSGFLFDPASGSVQQITDKTFDMEGADVSPDGTKILYWGVAYTGTRPDWKQLMEYDLASGQTRSLLPDGLLRLTPQVGYWGSEVFAEATAPHTSVYKTPELYLIDPATGERRSLGDPDGFLATSAVGDMALGGGRTWVPAGEKLYTFRLDHGDTQLLCIDKTGAVSAVAAFEGIAALDILGGSAYLVAMQDHRPQELYRQPLDGGAAERLTRFHDGFLSSRIISKPRHITFTSRIGGQIDGWVIEPPEHQAGQKCPGVLNIHGGPKAAYGGQYMHEMQLLAAQGWYVFYCDPHGSDGRGEDFFSSVVGRWGTLDFDDLMDFTDHVLALCPDLDPERLGVCGGSYGGYMTNWIIGHTNRFRAACAMRSISNMIASEMTCDKGYLFLKEHMTGATPWTDADLLWEKSPLKYVSNAVTPTLFIHSDTDYRCRMDEPLQMYTSLRQQGVPSKVVLIHGECHELSRGGRPLGRLTRLESLLDWFRQHL